MLDKSWRISATLNFKIDESITDVVILHTVYRSFFLKPYVCGRFIVLSGENIQWYRLSRSQKTWTVHYHDPFFEEWANFELTFKKLL